MTDELTRYQLKLQKSQRKVAILEEMIENQTRELFVTSEENKELANFAYVAAHDLQEPLNTVLSFTDQLKRECESGDTQNAVSYMEFISVSVNRMKELVIALLGFTTLGKKIEFEIVDTNELVENIRADLQVKIEAVGASISATALPNIKGDSTLLRLLFQNLISNAIKFQETNHKPEVSFSCEEKGGDWKFSVQDNGIGIPVDQLEKIFQLFQRLNSKGTYEGTGIGLATCRKIVDLHGGKIYAESEVGNGSAFHIDLPK